MARARSVPREGQRREGRRLEGRSLAEWLLGRMVHASGRVRHGAVVVGAQCFGERRGGVVFGQAAEERRGGVSHGLGEVLQRRQQRSGQTFAVGGVERRA